MDPETERQQSVNYFKIIKLLVNVGADVLREALLKEIPKTQLANEFARNYRNFVILKRQKVLRDPQFSLVTNPSPDPSQFDVSLLVALLRNICPNVQAPAKGWKESPNETDKSLGAELVRIRDIRNILHRASTLMPKGLFLPLWTDLVSIIIRIATGISPEVTYRITEKIVYLKQEDTKPDGENEKKFLQIFIAMSDMEEKMHYIKQSLDILHLKQDNTKDAIDDVREQGDASNKMLHAVKEQGDASNKMLHAVREQGDASNKMLHDVREQGDASNKMLHGVQEQLVQISEKVSSSKRPRASCSVLPDQVLHEVPEYKQLGQISKGIGKEYKHLAVELGLSIAEVDRIRENNPHSNFDQILNILVSWKKQKGKSATFGELERAMREADVDTSLALRDIQ